MSQSHTGYSQVRDAARELLQGDAPSRSFQVGQTTIVLSKVRVLESEAEMPEPFAKTDLPPSDDYGTWLK